MKHETLTTSRDRTPRQRRGAIFILTLGVIVILSGLVLVLAQEMQTEAIIAANRLAAAQADMTERGAEQWVMAQIELNSGDAVTITETPAEALQVGGGYFWLIRPDPDNVGAPIYGITDEGSKLSLNSAQPEQLALLPGMTDDIADSIVQWRGGQGTGTGGASDSYYQLLDESYSLKRANFETVEELLLVKDVTPELLWGFDRNRDGTLDGNEQASGGNSTLFGSGVSDDGRGMFNYLTVNTVVPNTDSNGSRRINVNNRDTGALERALTAALPASRAGQVAGRIQDAVRSAGRGRAFGTMDDFYTTSQMTIAEYKLVAEHLTTNTAQNLTGAVNVNTAPSQVLQCLSGLTKSDADALVSKREGQATGSISWIFDAIDVKKANGLLGGAITPVSYQFSADIVATSGDGRAFKRVRIIVDARETPAKIIYRKDLTNNGWPLPKDVLTSLRSGQGANGMGRTSMTSLP